MLRILLLVLLGALACGDDDAADAGSDTGTPDTGSADVGTDDAGDDAGGDDAGGDDAGGDDAGDDDAGGDDAGGDAGEADAGSDAGEADAGSDAGRTIFEGACARSFGNCVNDIDCMPSGCGSETCAPEEVISTCDCTMPPATCGCVDGACRWFN